MLSINTNLPSLTAQRSLSNSTRLLNQAIERMSTGFKINHASDNAANYSISTNMSTQISSYQVAEDNVASGLDLLSTADGALSLIGDKLSRLRALAEQAANGTYGEQSLKAIENEADAITDEIYRIKNSAEYNGKKLFGESVGPDMSRLRINNEGFIEDVEKRDTSSMTSLASISETSVLAKGTYSISSADELAKLARMQNSGKITEGSEFVLAADVDLSGFSNWTPIGWEAGNSNTTKAFCGTFDGNGYKITNLTSKQSGSSSAGLFGTIGDTSFKNLKLENVDINGNKIGSLAGYIKDNSNISIENCNAVNVSLDNIGQATRAGGLVGGDKDDTSPNTNITIISSYTQKVDIKNVFWGRAGGIIGIATKGTIKNCFSKELDVKSNNSCDGGIIGVLRKGEIENCFVIGNILDNSVDHWGHAGGIAGGDIHFKNCYFEGTLEHSSQAGGILSNCNGAYPVYIENCVVNATIKGYNNAGGIGGMMDCKGGLVKNCHFNGKVIGMKDNTVSGSIIGIGVEDILSIEDCTYNKLLAGDLPVIGDGMGNFKNVTDRNLNTALQVGIYGNEDSHIDFDTFLDLTPLMTLSFSGVQGKTAFETIDSLSLKISEMQTELGAVQNRLESAFESINVSIDNLTSSRSTLRDADVAEVSSEYIRQQILQQASATLMATANQSPALALQLL